MADPSSSTSHDWIAAFAVRLMELDQTFDADLAAMTAVEHYPHYWHQSADAVAEAFYATRKWSKWRRA